MAVTGLPMKKSATPDDVLPGKSAAPVSRRQRRTQLPTGPLWTKVADSTRPNFTPPATPPQAEPTTMNLAPTSANERGAETGDDLPIVTTAADEIPAALLGKFGGAKGPEFRVFPVTANGRGTKLFSFPPDAYPDADTLRAKIGREHGPGEYDVILYNAKGQPVAGGTTRLYVEDNRPTGAAAPAVTVASATSPPDNSRAELMELVRIAMGRPAPPPMDLAKAITAGAALVGAVGTIAAPLLGKMLDMKAPPKDPLAGMEAALSLAERVRQTLGKGTEERERAPGKWDALQVAVDGGVAMMKELRAMVEAEKRTPPRQLQPPPLAALPQPPASAGAPPGPAVAAEPEAAAVEYSADQSGLVRWIQEQMPDLCEMADANRGPGAGASYLHCMLMDAPQLVPVALETMKDPAVLNRLAMLNPDLRARLPWFEKVRERLVRQLMEDTDDASSNAH
jgi:hypothetical protein